MKPFLIIICLALFSIVVVFFAPDGLTRQPGRPAVAVSFIGFTNDATGTRMVSFAISNASSGPVVLGSHYRVQQPTGTRWTDLAEGWFTTGGRSLDSKQSHIVTVPVPANPPQWRIAFTSHTDQGALITMATELLVEGRKLGLPIRYKRIGYSIFSDTIQD